MPQEWQIHGSAQHQWTSLSALENLRLNKDVPKPTSSLPPRTALVRMRAAVLNARDMMVIAHDPIYPGDHIQDLVPCADGAGEVEAVGEGSKWRVGDRVIVHANNWMAFREGDEEMMRVGEITTKGAGSEQGTLREYGVLPDDHLIHAPSHLPFEELAALPACGSTTVNALFHGPLRVKPGQTVLAQGTGGVSCFVIQLAAAAGATVIATSSSDDKLAKARQMGAKFGINYTTHPRWSEEVLKLTGGKGVDHVVDIGGAGTIEESVKATKQGGCISLVGFLGSKAQGEETDLAALVGGIILGGKTVRGVFNWTREHAEEMVEMMEQYGIKPVVGRVFGWEDAKSAFECLNGQRAVGKIVVKIGS